MKKTLLLSSSKIAVTYTIAHSYEIPTVDILPLDGTGTDGHGPCSDRSANTCTDVDLPGTRNTTLRSAVGIISALKPLNIRFMLCKQIMYLFFFIGLYVLFLTFVSDHSSLGVAIAFVALPSRCRQTYAVQTRKKIVLSHRISEPDAILKGLFR